jgi:hypothetical protein
MTTLFGLLALILTISVIFARKVAATPVRFTLLPLLLTVSDFVGLPQTVLSDEVQSVPKKPLSPEDMATVNGDVLAYHLLDALQMVMKSGLAIGTKAKENPDGDAFLKASANDFAVAAEALLRAKAIASEMEIPQQKESCTLVVQNFENYLVAIGRFLDVTKEHDGTAQLAAAKDIRKAYDIAMSSLDFVGASLPKTSSLPTVSPN